MASTPITATRPFSPLEMPGAANSWCVADIKQ